MELVYVFNNKIENTGLENSYDPSFGRQYCAPWYGFIELLINIVFPHNYRRFQERTKRTLGGGAYFH